jgi:hypothetical protein
MKEEREQDEEESNERSQFWHWEISLIAKMKDEKRNSNLGYYTSTIPLMLMLEEAESTCRESRVVDRQYSI